MTKSDRLDVVRVGSSYEKELLTALVDADRRAKKAEEARRAVCKRVDRLLALIDRQMSRADNAETALAQMLRCK